MAVEPPKILCELHAMQVHFLGGANEVGASCVLIHAAGRRILVDAGVRMGSASRDRLPDLALATELGGLDAVLVTHAHLDHSGALPLVHGAFPKAPVVMTEPTLGLLRILLLDALKIMEIKSEKEGEIPLYPLPAVEALLARARGVPFLSPVRLCEGEVSATFFPAGHVLGAAAVGIETAEGNVLVTGDVSVTDQLTVPGMPLPRFSPALVVCESTYGARLHASRKAEEERLAETVVGALEQGRKVLIPAFALGRAQEVLLILRRTLVRAGLPNAVVYADGMVRAICGVYSQHADYLAAGLRRRADERRGLFFTADGRVCPVRSPQQREQILSGGPCVIVSSSGMLSGGPSAQYAARLVQDEQAVITITGYQDEEAPGRHLQEAARGQRRELILDGVAHEVRCQIQTYALSAHADGQELAGLVSSLHPKAVALVHGDEDARRGLAQALEERDAGEIHLPATGDQITLEPSSRRSRPRVIKGIGRDRPLDADTLAALHEHLWRAAARSRTYSLQELAEQWYGSTACPEDLSPFREMLRASQPHFAPDRKRPFLFRTLDPEAATRGVAGAGVLIRDGAAGSETEAARDHAGATARDAQGRLEQNAALALVDQVLSPDAGVNRRGADRESWTLRVSFDFPLVAAQAFSEQLAQIAEQTGWGVEVNPETNLAALQELARGLVQGMTLLKQAPSISREDRSVKIAVSDLPPEAEQQALSAEFERRTGFSLRFKAEVSKTPAAKQAWDADGRMEVNLALAEIEAAFVDQPHRPYKKSKKSDASGPYIELSFVAPEVGERYRDLLDALEARICWAIRVGKGVNQQEVLNAVRALIPASWPIKKGPGLDLAGRKVRLRLERAPSAEELQRVGQQLEELAGFGLEVL